MGPPRRRGGRGTPAPRAVRSTRRFNGATSSSRWKVVVVVVVVHPRIAASMGPPRRRGGRSRRSRKIGLVPAGASMGPPRRRGGRFFREAAAPARIVLLQWGHLVVEVEGRRQPQGLPLPDAASMGPPRRRGGRDLAIAAHRRERDAASMGPPRRRGGRGLVLVGVEVLVGASMGPPRRRGGRGADKVGLLECGVASMGPPRRRGGRGFDSEAGAPSRPATLQWGHLVVEVEGPRSRMPPVCWPGCFNGATSSSRWKAFTSHAMSAGWLQLQWGHLVVEVEGRK